ncbi:MAG TPA: amino acid adenylation domain-containing protein, partial [Actinomycetota bacterium]|nr:amino acid adenylation domain-containing protein [Actinomycetota bacterium]
MSKFDLTLNVDDSEPGSIAFEYSTDLFEAATIDRMAGHLQTLLEGAVEEPGRRISELPLLTPAERQQILREWNATERVVPQAAVHDLFAAQAGLTPEAIAVVADDGILTYAELDRRSNRLARRLRRLGVRPGALAAAYVERSTGMMVALFGILKAGGAYMPLDPAYPLERIAVMLEDAHPAVIVAPVPVAGLPASDTPIVGLDDDVTESDAPLAAGTDPEDLAYVIFTSGSTGRPKGVQVPHRALTNLLGSMGEAPGLSGGDVLLAVTTLAFDIAGLELFLPLVTGARVVLASRETAGDPSALAALIDESGATVMQATPATWRMLIDSGWGGRPGLRVLCGGEALPVQLAGELRARSGELWNVYGPTETTIWSTAERVEEVGSTVSIGRPIANTSVYVLDARLQPVPRGARGELYIGGRGVARGYLDRPELTAERFVPDPFGDEPGARMYRTGDLARYRSDGRLECGGRVDHQLKLRGFRIEPGEIEAELRAHPEVRDCVVVVREEHADRRLVAYVVGRAEGRTPAAELRRLLESRLPAHMVPSAFVTLPALPRTPNGKVDRRALPAPGLDSTGRAGADVPPRSPVEEVVAGIWREALGLERVGIHENFFHLGGHSLLATRVVSRLRDTFRTELPLRTLFEKPTVAGLAMHIEAARRRGAEELSPSIVPAPRDGVLP